MKNSILIITLALAAIGFAGCFQTKGVTTDQVQSRSKAGETTYTATRDDRGDGSYVSTVTFDSRKDAKMAGAASAVIVINSEATTVTISGETIEALGEGQVGAQGTADAVRVNAVGEAAGSLIKEVVGGGVPDPGGAVPLE